MTAGKKRENLENLMKALLLKAFYWLEGQQ
jgi:hypothetical protein